MAWRTTGILADAFIAVVPPQQRAGETWYRGTADAVLQNLHLVDDFAPDTVAVFGADHIYRMDISQMLAFHLESGADATVAARPVRLEQASSFGVLAVDRQHRVVAWDEKPPVPAAMPDDPGRALVSMGNYISGAAVDALLDDARRSTATTGRSIAPEMVAAGGCSPTTSRGTRSRG
jgi:glucose-1-phosphate adenylyltransferase